MMSDPKNGEVDIVGGPTPETPSLAERTRDRIRARIRAFIASADEDPYALREAARALDVLPLVRASDERWHGVRPDGDVVLFAPRAPHDESEEDDQWLRAVVLSRVVERYPELDALVPPPPLSCRTCPRCRGVGEITLRGQPAPCVCGGLGWLPSILDEIGKERERDGGEGKAKEA